MDKAPPESTAPTQNKRQPSGAVVRVSRIASLSAQWRDERLLYVVINLAVNLLVLVRAYVSLLVLDYRDLGLITLLQSVVLLLGMLQFGVINGAYRLILSARDDEQQDLVNFVFSFIGVLCAVALIAAGFALVLTERHEDGLIGAIGVIGGAASLVRNWQSNLLIAEQRLAMLNTINLVSAIVALCFFAILPFSPLFACMAVIMAQPCLFVMLAAFVKEVRKPSRFVLDWQLARRIMAAGFIVFLSGMLLQLNVQIERWYVIAELSIEALGHLFIAIMVLTLLQLVPNALDAIMLPAAVQANEAQETARLAKTMRSYLWLLVGYALVVGLGIAFLAEPVLAILAPKYVDDLIYVYLIIPGALTLTIASAFALAFSVLIRYRYLLIAYGGGSTLLGIILLGAALSGNKLSLESVMIVRGIGLVFPAILIVIGWWIVTRDKPGLRFRNSSPNAS